MANIDWKLRCFKFDYLGDLTTNMPERVPFFKKIVPLVSQIIYSRALFKEFLS